VVIDCWLVVEVFIIVNDDDFPRVFWTGAVFVTVTIVFVFCFFGCGFHIFEIRTARQAEHLTGEYTR